MAPSRNIPLDPDRRGMFAGEPSLASGFVPSMNRLPSWAASAGLLLGGSLAVAPREGNHSRGLVKRGASSDQGKRRLEGMGGWGADRDVTATARWPCV